MNLNESPPISINLESLKVSVIICCYTMERLNDIKEAVESVLNQTLKPHEVILAIDHNKELFRKLVETYRDSIEIRRKFPNLNGSQPISIKIVLNTGAPGISVTRNLGIRTATGHFIAFMDDDAIADKNWLEILIRNLSQNPSAAVIGGKCILIWPKEKRPLWFAEELDWIVGGTYKGMPVSSNGQIRNVSGCNMLATKELFEKAGLFSTRIGAVAGFLRGAEEAEMCLRLKKAFPEKPILYEPEAIVHHKVHLHRLTLGYIIRRSFDEGFSKAKVQKLHRRTLSTQQTLDSRLRTFDSGLSTEHSYLRYLFFTSIPERLRHFYQKSSFLQAATIIISIAATGAGYLIGKIKTQNLEP
ncbi:hypothetical protein ES706_01372 [subsurface metagenome]|nr:glycosyltransferase [Dehalococcoidia bacterium]